MAERPGVLFRFEMLDGLEQLSRADAGELFIAAMRYGKDGTAPTFQNPLLSVVWSFIKTAVDHDAEVYDGKILQRQHAVYCREAKRRGEAPMDFDTWKSSGDIDRCVPITSDIHYQHQDHTHSHTQEQVQKHTQEGLAAQPPARPRFRPPSVEEVRSYCAERGNAIDPEHFVSYYESVGWKIGKNPMKSWKSAVITWEKREGGQQHGSDNGHSQGRSAEDADSRWNLDAIVL